MKKLTKLSLLLLTTVMVLALSMGASPSHAKLFGVSEQEEIAAGKEVRQQVYKEYGKPLPANDPMSRRVRAIGERFAALSSRENIPYSYEVLKNDEVLNAFAAPGGPIFVTTKLITTASNDAELAYVLGHETTHIDHQHIVKTVEKQQKVALGVGILGSILGKGGSAFDLLSNAAFTVWSQGYSRSNESDADEQGIRWMSELGFDPHAAVTMLQKLDSGGGGGTLDKYLASHPDPKSRQKAAQQLIEKENLENVANKAGGPSLNALNLPAFKGYGADFSGSPYANTNTTSNIVAGGGSASPMIIAVRNGKNNVVMVAVRQFSEWADGTGISANKKYTTLKRGNNSIRLSTNSRTARINGKNVTMSVPAQIRQGSLYAPIGNVAEGVGGKVVWDGARHGVNVTVGKQSTFWALGTK